MTDHLLNPEEASDEVKTLESVIRSLQEDLEQTRTYATELEEQLEQAKTCLNAVNSAVNAITFPW